MSTDFEEKLSEWAHWYFEHCNDSGDVHMQILFLKKAMDGCMDLLSLAAKDIQALEQRGKSQSLFTPGQIRIRGGLR